MTTLELGPLMAAVLDAQHRQGDALRYPRIGALAADVVAVARKRRCDLLWPVDSGAHKLMGAIEMLTAGGIDVRMFDTAPAGRRILLVASVGLSGAELARESAAVRRADAAEVHGCAIDAACGSADLDSFTVLHARASAVTRSA